MSPTVPRRTAILLLALSAALLSGTGCGPLLHPYPDGFSPYANEDTSHLPRELHKAVLPEYRVEPPDVLVVTAVHVVPRSPYRLRTLDSISIVANGDLPDEPLDGVYPIEIGGMVNLGPTYGKVRIDGMLVEEASEVILKKLKETLKSPEISVSLADFSSREQIAGPHLVAPDGRITLGSYGSLPVVGFTREEAKSAVEQHLSQYFDDPEVSVDVLAYNSKSYYIVTQGAGFGDKVYSFPSTGNETVLDAVAQINGLNQTSSKRIWIARPGRTSGGCDQVLPVDWLAITQRGDATTNFQVLPGDRVYVAEDKMVAFDTRLSKLIAPFERIMGFTILGTETVTRLSGNVLAGGGNQRNGGF